jgi:hypothetical protein
LLVQEGNEQPFRISCTIESRFSRCTPLPKGASFEAKRGKKGVTLYYIDDKGRARSQLYKLVDGGSKTSSTATAVAVATPPVPATTDTAEQTSVAPAQHPSVAVQKAPASAPLPPLSQPAPREKVKCNFSSTPPGAEISVDWRYVGNTPSEIGLSAGTHVIVISTPGFAEWKRELTVASDSEVNVTAILQKTQP